MRHTHVRGQRDSRHATSRAQVVCRPETAIKYVLCFHSDTILSQRNDSKHRTHVSYKHELNFLINHTCGDFRNKYTKGKKIKKLILKFEISEIKNEIVQF